MLGRARLRVSSRVYPWLAAAWPIAIVWSRAAASAEAALAASFGLAASASLLPAVAVKMIRTEDAIGLRFARVTPGRLARLALHAPVVLVVATLVGTATGQRLLDAMTFVIATAASAALQSLAFRFAYHGRGERTSNLVLALAVAAWLVASVVVEPAVRYLAVTGAAVYLADLLVGALADLRSFWFPRAGVGVFFGSFNPVHNSHLRMIRDALDGRRLDTIYVHCTTVPKLHRQALERGEIAMSREAGMRIYSKTSSADPGKNYFPTGNRFYDYEVRRELLRAACGDAGLAQRVEVLDLPDIYDKEGFVGVLREVRRRHRGQPLHGLHGSDTGGMWVRNLFDDCGWVFPCAVVRTDGVSATAIRSGATGLTSETVERFLVATGSGQDFVFASGYCFEHVRNPDRDVRVTGDCPAASTTME
ncbi:hypothetical protein ACTJLC_11865 [Paraburkholderia sp. 22099]|nr:hypothetical protein [Paraburkholderia terricola]